MARLRVSTTLSATPAVVWADLADVSSHVGWMRDAVAVRFVTAAHQGVGTQFDCDTNVGPSWRAGSRAASIVGWRSR